MTVAYILLPPSESKSPGGRTTSGPDTFADNLRQPRGEIHSALARLASGQGDPARVYRAQGVLLERAILCTQELIEGRAALRSAWHRYTGVVWEYLEPASLSTRQRRRLLIPSALYGLTTGTDLVADYRLTFHVSLPQLGSLSRYWRASITAALVEHCRSGPVVNLLPNEHANALDLVQLSEALDLRTVRFVDEQGTRTIGHEAKAVKGAFARHLLDEGLDNATSFRWPHWRVRTGVEGIELRRKD